MMEYGNHLTGWGWFGMGLGMVLFWGLVIAAIVVLVRWVSRPGNQQGDGPAAQTPEQLLAERFARGEIDHTEYQSRLATLRGKKVLT